jgi:hypothetical protein
MMLPKLAVITGLLLMLLTASLSACGGRQLPPLGQPGQPTLVFIYTDN